MTPGSTVPGVDSVGCRPRLDRITPLHLPPSVSPPLPDPNRKPADEDDDGTRAVEAVTDAADLASNGCFEFGDASCFEASPCEAIDCDPGCW